MFSLIFMGSIICIVFVVRVKLYRAVIEYGTATVYFLHIFTIMLMNNVAHENVRLNSMS